MQVAQPINQSHVVTTPARQDAPRAGMGVVPRSIESIRRKNKKILVGLGIAEVVLGSLCLLLGAIITSYADKRSRSYNNYRPYDNYGSYSYIYNTYDPLNIGEGIWCGIWILIAGGVGIAAGGKRSSRCLIITHMAFAIVGSIFSGTLFIIDVSRARGTNSAFFSGLIITTIVASFISVVILIVSASYCCCINFATFCRGCDVACTGCGCDEVSYPYANRHQVVHIANQSQQQQQQQLFQQQPINLQGFPVTTNQLGQSYVIQQIPGSQMNQQTFVPMQQTPGFSMPNVAYLPAATSTGTSNLAYAQMSTPTTVQLTESSDVDGNHVQQQQNVALNVFPIPSNNNADYPPVYSHEQ